MAARFWVNGTGTWDASNTVNWAATTGGAAGASVPGAADVVTFDANSGTGFTCTVATGYNPTVISVAGGFATVTLNLNNQTLTCTTFNFSGAATGAVRALAWGTTGQITITGNGTNVFTTQIDNNLTCSGSRNVVFTYTGGTGTRTIGTVPASVNFPTNSLNYIIQGGTDTVTLGGSSGIAVRNLDFTGFSGTLTNNQMFAYGSVTLSAAMTLPLTVGNWTFRGPSGGTQTLTMAGKTLPASLTVNAPGGTVVFADDVTGLDTATLTLTAGTLNLNERTVNIGLFSTPFSGVRTMAFGTASILNITGNSGSVWNCIGTANLIFTGNKVVNFTYAGATGTRQVALGPLTQASALNINFPSGTDTLTIFGNAGNITFSGYSGTVANASRIVYGNFTVDVSSASMTFTSGAGVTTFAGSGVQTFDSAEVVTDFSFTIGNGTSNGTVVFANAVTTGNTQAVTLTSGTLDANGYNITVGLFSSSGASIRALDISDTTVTLNGIGVVWNTLNASNLTATVSNSTVLLSDDTTATKTVRLGTLPALDNIVIGGNTSTANTILLSDANTIINSITSTKTVAQTIGLSGSLTVNSWGIVGTAAAPVTLADNGSATVANLHYAGTGTVDVSYYTISYSAATPSNTWYALLTDDNINAGNNSGWIFNENTSSFFLVF